MQSETEISLGEGRQRAEELYLQHRQDVFRHVDRLFAILMIAQWLFAIGVALIYSPYAWSGRQQSAHAHVYAAVGLGGAISSLPVVLAYSKPGAWATRHVIACAQMLWSALLIHLTGGRVETHFHVFGSLAFLSFYRDWSVLVPATLTVATEHLLRQLFWPESVYGVINPEWWRFVEHAFWVAFEDAVLIVACVRAQREMQIIARRQAMVEELSAREQKKSEQLAASQDALVRSEKLAAVGRLAASVGHELRNPLTAVRNANAVLQKHQAALGGDEKTNNLLKIIHNEVGACTRIIGELLDFAREQPLKLEATPLRPLVDEALGVVTASRPVNIQNLISESLPPPLLDRAQFRQVLINLLQNAFEAIPEDKSEGRVTVSADVDARGNLSLLIEDTGEGMSREVVAKIFEPLFTTKTKGTGLGMAIVANIIKRHQADIHVESEPGRGTRVRIDVPAQARERAA